MTRTVIVERPVAGLAVVTLNRPDVMNALSLDLRRAIVRSFAELAQAGDVRVVILTGAGRGFCGGLDLAELSVDTGALAGSAETDPVAATRDFPGVVIGAINGVAVTGGFELALACDILIASETARFADTHARVGVLPGWQLSQRLSRTIGLYRAKQMSLTGMMLSATQAAAWGLVGEVVEPGRLLDRAREIANTMLTMPPAMLIDYKRLIDDGYALTFEEGLAVEHERSAAHNGGVAPAAIADRRSGIQQTNRAGGVKDETA